MKKGLFAISLVLGIISCNQSSGKLADKLPEFTPHSDSTHEVLVRTVKGGPIYVPLQGWDSVVKYAAPRDTVKPGDSIARVIWKVDTIWRVRQHSDTARDAKGNKLKNAAGQDSIRVYPWQQVDRRFVQVIDVPRQ